MKWSAIGESVRGSFHITNNMPCQDAIKIAKNEKYIICSVADGHGSPDCKFSDEGATAATDVVNLYFESLFSETTDVYDFLRGNRAIHLPKKIEQLWKEKIQSIHKEKDTESGLTESQLYKLYGTTLLSILITDDFIFCLQIGDGDILEVLEDGTTSYLIDSEVQLGTETNSLCQKESWKFFKSILIKISEQIHMPALFIISTDGYVNSFASENDFLSIGNDYLENITKTGLQKTKENLTDWLSNTSQGGSGDDITIGLIYREV